MKGILSILLAAVLLSGCAAVELPPETTAPAPWVLPESPYTPGDFVMEGDFLTCTAGVAVAGIDVSSHQGAIDWQQVAEAGIQFAFVRIGYRGYDTGAILPDTRAEENLKGAQAAGLLVGAYFFSQAVSIQEAREEALFAMDRLKEIGVELDLPLVYDWEYVSETARTGNVDRETLTACTLAFCKAAQARGYEPMVYFNTSQGRDLLELEKLEEYPWWLAKYDLDGEFLCQVDLWQYTNQGQVPGIQGKVDIDLMFADYGLGQRFFG